jgi:hypothetical protein
LNENPKKAKLWERNNGRLVRAEKIYEIGFFDTPICLPFNTTADCERIIHVKLGMLCFYRIFIEQNFVIYKNLHKLLDQKCCGHCGLKLTSAFYKQVIFLA